MTIYILYMLFKRLRKKIRKRIALRKLVAEKANKWSQQAHNNIPQVAAGQVVH